MKSGTDGQATVEIHPRQAMVPYILDFYRLRPTDPAVEILPIKLENYDEIRKSDRRN